MIEHETISDSYINEVATSLQQRGWGAVALVLLEAGRPLTFIGGQLLWLLQPALATFGTTTNVTKLARLLEDPTAVGTLIDRLEMAETA